MNIKSIKTLTAGALLALANCLQAFAGDTGSCGTNCVYTYSNGTLTYSVADANSNNGKGKITISNYYYGIDDTIENIIVNEGITSVEISDHSGFINVGTANGKLVLPDNFTTGINSMWGLGFGTIEFGNNVTIGAGSFRFNDDADVTLVMNADANITFDDGAMDYYATSKSPNSIHIACKGDPDSCYDKFSNVRNKRNPGNVTYDYYQEEDSEGNVILYNDTGYSKYDSDGNIIAKYDVNDHLLTQYRYATDGSVAIYDANGKLIGLQGKRIYTIDEATQLLGSNNKNTFSIRYR